MNTVTISSHKPITEKNLEGICKNDFSKYKSFIKDQDIDKYDEHLLPSIKKIVSQPMIKATRIKGNSSKIMGEHYNPFNYNSDSIRSQIKRNVYGSLYQH